MKQNVTEKSRRLEEIASNIEQLVEEADSDKTIEENARELSDTYEEYQRLKVALSE